MTVLSSHRLPSVTSSDLQVALRLLRAAGFVIVRVEGEEITVRVPPTRE